RLLLRARFGRRHALTESSPKKRAAHPIARLSNSCVNGRKALPSASPGATHRIKCGLQFLSVQRPVFVGIELAKTVAQECEARRKFVQRQLAVLVVIVARNEIPGAL